MKTFVSKVHGIKFHFAGSHIGNYKLYEFLKLEPEPSNQYDENAIKIFDISGNFIGYVAANINVYVLSIINQHDYYCYISHVYYDREKPSIEYTIVYRECRETASDFEENLTRYKQSFNSDIEEESADDLFDDIDIKKPVRKHHNNTERDKKDLYNGALKMQNGFYEEAYELLEPLAESGNEYALFFCGHLLFSGNGVARDYKKAFEYFNKAKENGCSRTDFEIGQFYELGIVVEKDIDKAVEYYKKAAYEERCFEAIHRLASMYFTVIGLPLDIDKFFECLDLVDKYNNEIQREMTERNR